MPKQKTILGCSQRHPRLQNHSRIVTVRICLAALLTCCICALARHIREHILRGHCCRGRQKSTLVDFCALGPVPQERLRQAAPAAICLKTAPTKADTLLPEDHHYQARAH